MAKKTVSRPARGCNSNTPKQSICAELAQDVILVLSALTAVTRQPAATEEDRFFARSLVTSCCNMLTAAPEQHSADRALQQMGAMIRALVATWAQSKIALLQARMPQLRPVAAPEQESALPLQMFDAACCYLDAALVRAAFEAQVKDARPALTRFALGQTRSVGQTEVSFAFALVLRDLDACVSAYRLIERDVIPDVFAQDFGGFLTDAERAFEKLTDALSKLRDMEPSRDMDRPLILLADMLHGCLGIEDLGDRAHVSGMLLGLEDLTLVRGADPVARLVRAYQTHFFHSAQALMAMEDFCGTDFELDTEEDEIEGDFPSM